MRKLVLAVSLLEISGFSNADTHSKHTTRMELTVCHIDQGMLSMGSAGSNNVKFTLNSDQLTKISGIKNGECFWFKSSHEITCSAYDGEKHLVNAWIEDRSFKGQGDHGEHIEGHCQ